MTPIGLLTLTLQIPGCTSLKQKRSRVKPFLTRLHREFNLSVAEAGALDSWGESIVVGVMIGNNGSFMMSELEKVVRFCSKAFPDLEIIDHRIEII
ncbi:MAG: DUF503 domain-containing protein [Anaerolineae bacterium]|nr:DUF503 domain-containing protein [Anaerolineae bacterium]